MPIDFANRRALVAEDSDDAKITFTAVEDLANVVARAVDYEGEWPRIGGISGTTLTLSQLFAIGERVRGKSFCIFLLSFQIEQQPSLRLNSDMYNGLDFR